MTNLIPENDPSRLVKYNYTNAHVCWDQFTILMSQRSFDDVESKRVSKTSPCLRYERFDKSTTNLIGVGVSYMGMDTEECIEVLWVEIRANFLNETVIRNHFDTINRFKHPCLLKFHTYWVEHQEGSSTLYFICEYICDTLFHFIKRTHLNDKAIPLKTQVRILKQILFGLGYLSYQNPPFYLPSLNSGIIFMTHDGCIKLSTIIPNKYIHSVLLCKDYCRYNQPDNYYQSLLNFSKILYSMACLHYNPEDDWTKLVEKGTDSCLVEDHLDFLNMVIKNQAVLISDLLKSKLLFCFPSLKFIAANCVIKSGIDVNEYNFDYPPEKVFSTYVESSKNFYYSDVPSVDIQRFLVEVKQGLHQFTNNIAGDIYKRSSHGSPTIKSPTTRTRELGEVPNGQNSIRVNDTTFVHDLGPVIALKCGWITPNTANKQMKKIRISILYQNLYCRIIEREINVATDAATLITDDIIDEKLLSEKYRSCLNNLISYSLQGEELSLVLSHIL